MRPKQQYNHSLMQILLFIHFIDINVVDDYEGCLLTVFDFKFIAQTEMYKLVKL